MHLGRKVLATGVVIVVFLGAVLASDPRFVSHSTLAGNPILAAFIYGPTILFAVIAVIKWRNGRIWPAVAFAVGLMCTGLFHQIVAGAAYGNPGYMFPASHILAPIVSLAAYLVSFLVGWIVVIGTHKIRRARSGEET